jgi:nucleolar complex protein 3
LSIVVVAKSRGCRKKIEHGPDRFPSPMIFSSPQLILEDTSQSHNLFAMSRYPLPKRRKLSPPESEDESGRTKRGQNTEKWDNEQDYEQRIRKIKATGSGRLPIKTSEGWVAQEVPLVEATEYPAAATGEEDEDMDGQEKDDEPKKSTREQILEAKEEMARLAGLINEDPEEHMASLRSLTQFAASKNVTIKKLVLATQCAVYKDIIPGYRIRPAAEDEMATKLSREVKKLRNYEQALVGGYQSYVRELEKCAKGSKDQTWADASGLASVALSCAGQLLLAVPHFNFRGDLVKILITKLSTKRMDEDYKKCLLILEDLFRKDDDGHPSLDAVTQLTRMIKAKNFNVHESLLNTFLHLRLLTEFMSKGSHHGIDKQKDEEQPDLKLKKKNREFLTKRQRKERKERKVVEKELKEADAVVSHEERDQMQSEMLKMVFITYFRILQAKPAHLMGAVLEGLARYADRINQEFFGDILEALKDLILETEANLNEDEEEVEEQEEDGMRNVTREALLCVVTAFALLQGQDAAKSAGALHLDLSFFITHLYRTLYPVALNCDIELGPKSMHLPDPNGDSDNPSIIKNKVNAQTTTVLLIRCLSSVLLPPLAVRAVPPIRIAAFTKQLLTASLHLPQKSCQAMLSLLSATTKTHGRKVAGLWNTEERRGDGMFDALRGEVEGSNPFASTAWEGEILRLHWCPKVRESVGMIEKNVLDV